MRKYVSEVVTTEMICKFKLGENYLIGSEMGSGKNYWVRNILLPYALDNNMKTLILTHRTINNNQQLNYLLDYSNECIRQFKGGMFELTTYQHLEQKIKCNDFEYLNQFNYIVCDEAHYFTKDSTINNNTHISFSWLNSNDKVIKIFMTATYESLFYLPFKRSLITIKEANYTNNNINALWRYEKDETILSIIEDTANKAEKVLIFHNSIENGEIFKNTLSCNTALLHSGNKIASEDYSNIINDNKFNCQVLNTTSLMSEGTEIKDKNVKTIVINGIIDLEHFVQSPARIRETRIDIYYKKVTKRQLLCKIRALEKQLFYYDEFITLGEIDFVKEYGLDVIDKRMKALYLDTVIDSISGQEYTQLKTHVTNLANLNYQYDCYTEILENGFERMLERFFPNVIFYDLEELVRQELIKADIIDRYLDKKLYKQQQKALVNVICNKYKLKAKNGSNSIGIKSINNYFKDNDIEYKIESKRIKENNKLHTVWILKAI